MLGSGCVLTQHLSEKKQEEEGGVRCCGSVMMAATNEEFEKYIKAGNGYLMGFVPPQIYDYDDDDDPDLIPRGALPEHRSKFKHIWFCYDRQLQITNGMDLDTYPGPTMVTDTVPLRWPTTNTELDDLVVQLANLALEEYNNEELNVFTYKLLRIEKLNTRLTGYLEFFMTVKATNLTLGTVVETFQIHAGRHMGHCGLLVFSCLPKGGVLVDEEMAGSESRQFSPEKKPNSAEELLAWQTELPSRFLANEVLWDDDVFIPEGASKKHPAIFRRIYWRYFNQICETEGFDIDIYPGDSKAAMYIPYLDFATKIDLLMDLAKYAIQDYNNTENDDYKYEVVSIEKVNYIVVEFCEFLMIVKVKNLTLRTPIETFQIHAYRGPHEENVVRLCRRKHFQLSLN